MDSLDPGVSDRFFAWDSATNVFRLVVEMADILAFNLTQTVTANGVSFKPRKMNPPDLSTKLKLMGVDV
jgi:hypothetical protein